MLPNVLLVILDSVRARNTSLHGHVHDTTPFLHQFAEDTATHYLQARAPGARSITSHASIFTGLDVPEHGILSADHRLKPGTTVFERLRDESGYTTGVFSENVWITEVDIGLRDGFDTVIGPQNIPFPDSLDPRTFVAQEGRGQYGSFLRECFRGDSTAKSLINGVYIKLASDYPGIVPILSGSTPASVYRDLFLEWVSEAPSPWAACINLMDAHEPYRPQDEHNHWGDQQLLGIEDAAPDKWELHCSQTPWWMTEATENLYDGAIHQADAALEQIFQRLRERGVLDDTLVVVTSDHGEGFGEPSRIRPDTRVAAHNVSVHEVLLHVPLVVKFPGQTEPEQVEEGATLTKFDDVVRAAVDGSWSTNGFVPDGPVRAITYGLTKDRQLRSRALRYCEEDDLWAFDAPACCIYEDTDEGTLRKYVTWRSEEACIMVRDAQTSYKIASEGAEEVDRVFENIQDAGVRTEGAGVADLDESTYQHLEDLGYV